MNTSLSYKFNYDGGIHIDGSVLQPTASIRFLGVKIENEHVQYIPGFFHAQVENNRSQ